MELQAGRDCGTSADIAATEPAKGAWANRRVPSFLRGWVGRPWSLRRKVAVGVVSGLLLLVGAPCLFLAWQIHRSGVAIDILTPWIARTLSQQLGDGRQVRIGAATMVRHAEGQVEVEAQNVTILDADGRRLASMPRVALGLDGLPLLGRPNIRRIDLVGASVALKVGEDGQIAFAAGRFNTVQPEGEGAAEPGRAAPTLAPPAEPEPELSPFRRLGIWLDLIEKSGFDGHRLVGFGLRNGTVIVDDIRSGKRFVFYGIELDLTAPQTGGLSFALGASGSGARWTSTAIVTPRDSDGRRAIDVVMTGLSPRDLSLAVQHPEVFYADTPISGTLRAMLDPLGDPSGFSGRVVLGKGRVGDLKDPAMRLDIDHAAAQVRWQAGASSLTVDRIEIASGENRAELTGSVTPPLKPGDPLVVEIANARTVTSLLNPHEPPAAIGLTNSRFVYDPQTKLLTVERMLVDQGAETRATITGNARLTSAAPAVSLRIAAGRMPLGDALKLWPRITNPHVRDWVADNMSGGTVENVDVALDIPEGVLTSMPVILEPEALKVQSKLRGTSLRVLPNLTPLREADVDVTVDGKTASLQVMRGIVEPSPGKRLTLSRGSFEIADHRVEEPRSVSRFRLEGAADAAFDLLGQEAFKGAASGPALPSGPVRGNVVANVTVAVPITDRLRQNQIDYRVEADFAGFSADKAFGEMRVDNASFRVSTTPRDFTMRGEGRLGGAQANFEYRKPRPEAKPVIRLTATLDDAGRQRLGLNIGPRVTGPTPLKVTTEGEESGRYTVEADLTQAVLADLLPGWSKPRGQAAKARFVAVETDDGWKLEDLVVEGRGVIVRGSAVLDGNGGLVSGVFPAYNLSDGDRINLRVERAGNGHKVAVRGDMMDARALLRSMTEPPRTGSGPGGAASGEVDIDLKLAAVVGSNGEVIRQFEMRLLKRGTDMRALTAAGRVGHNAPFAAELRGQGSSQRLVVSAGDAGALLRFLDIYKTLQGGDLALVMTPIQPDGGIRDGNIEITNFAVRGDRAISGMVAAVGEGPGTARRSQAQQPVDAFAFSRLRAQFSRAQGKVTVSDGLLWGAAIGATVEGEFEPSRDRLRLRGTYVPAYALNNMFARIPVLGFFLGGAPDEGVIGITYEISGQASAPRLTVNPLSAVTPGFLRKMFEFRGGPVGGQGSAVTR